jgi:lysophospholipase L1-like esterase
MIVRLGRRRRMMSAWVLGAAVVVGADLSGGSIARAQDKGIAAPEEASIPAPKKDNGNFLKRHESFVKRAKEGNVDVLFLGDSITAGWAGAGKDVWAKRFEKFHPANFGIGGDRTQHVLWRVTNGELEGISPKVVVLMLGTNNIKSDPPDAVARADAKLVRTIREKLPQTKVLLLGIFPRAHKTDSPEIPGRVKAVNEQLAKLDDGKNVRYLDLAEKLAPGGKEVPEYYTDGVHLTAKGYEVWADAIEGMLGEMAK